MPIIYAIVGEQTQAVKIGKTSARSAKGRLERLQTGSAEILSILGEANGRPGRDERILHTLFAPYHIHGEWFDRRVTVDILEALKVMTFEEWMDKTIEAYQSDPIGFVCKFYKDASPDPKIEQRKTKNLLTLDPIIRRVISRQQLTPINKERPPINVHSPRYPHCQLQECNGSPPHCHGR